jgi:hypothetical protein
LQWLIGQLPGRIDYRRQASRHPSFVTLQPNSCDAVGTYVDRTLDGAAELAGIVGGGIPVNIRIAGLTQQPTFGVREVPA